MKKWKPAPPEAAAAFTAATKGVAGLEPRKMFGYDCAFANSRMVTGLHQEGMVLRLPDDERERITDDHGAEPFVVMGRTMREYVVIPPSLLADTRALERWVRRGLAYAESMPPKEKAKSSKSARRPARKTAIATRATGAAMATKAKPARKAKVAKPKPKVKSRAPSAGSRRDG